uniref:Uncharacterized protein n=1 Tax=Anguilla anguilla TaxID=7936 RepID=A0A0E9PCV3_ANGAN
MGLIFKLGEELQSLSYLLFFCYILCDKSSTGGIFRQSIYFYFSAQSNKSLFDFIHKI